MASPAPSDSHHSNPFDILPIETNQNIASFLDYDSDICKYRLICRSTLNAVDADNCSFWRRGFLACFEKPTKSMDNVAYKKAYQRRRGVLKCGAAFQTGEKKREWDCLEVLRDLVIGELHHSSVLAQCRGLDLSTFDRSEGGLLIH